MGLSLWPCSSSRSLYGFRYSLSGFLAQTRIRFVFSNDIATWLPTHCGETILVCFDAVIHVTKVSRRCACTLKLDHNQRPAASTRATALISKHLPKAGSPICRNQNRHLLLLLAAKAFGPYAPIQNRQFIACAQWPIFTALGIRRILFVQPRNQNGFYLW